MVVLTTIYACQCEALASQFDIVDASERPDLGIQGTLAYFKGTSQKEGPPLFSYVCPTVSTAGG